MAPVSHKINAWRILMKKIAILAVVALVLTFSSCDEFFSSTLGSSRSYDPAKINVNAGNIDDWVKACIGNKKLAAAVSEAIIRELGKLPDGSPAKAALLAGGIKIAAESSGFGESVLARAAELLGKGSDFTPESMTELFALIQADFKANGGSKAADNIAAMAKAGMSGTGPGGTPKLDPAYAANATPSDVAQAIMVLVMGEMGDTGVGDGNWSDLDSNEIYIGIGLADGLGIDEGTKKVIVTGTGDGAPSANALALAAYLNLLSDQNGLSGDNSLNSALYEAFFTSNQQ